MINVLLRRHPLNESELHTVCRHVGPCYSSRLLWLSLRNICSHYTRKIIEKILIKFNLTRSVRFVCTLNRIVFDAAHYISWLLVTQETHNITEH